MTREAAANQTLTPLRSQQSNAIKAWNETEPRHCFAHRGMERERVRAAAEYLAGENGLHCQHSEMHDGDDPESGEQASWG